MNLTQIIPIIILLYLIFSSYVDLKQHKTYALPWLLISAYGFSSLLFTIFIDKVPLSVVSYYFAIILLPLTVSSVLMYFSKFQLGDILSLISIGLSVPVSPFLVVSIFPFNLMAVSVFLNGLFLWFVYSTVRRSFKNRLPFLPFLTMGYILSLIGL